MVAVGFSPRNVGQNVRVAERRLPLPSRAFQVSLRDTACLPWEPWAEAHGYRQASRWDDFFHSLNAPSPLAARSR